MPYTLDKMPEGQSPESIPVELTSKQAAWQRYYKKHQEHERQRTKEWKKANPEKLQAQYDSYNAWRHPEHQAEYRQLNIDQERERERVKARKFREEHPDYNKEWRKANPDKVRERSSHNNYKRRAAKRNVPSERIDLNVVWAMDHGVCGICNEPVMDMQWHLDHIIPISKGGSHTYDNVQVSHPRCNLIKHDKLEHEVTLAKLKGHE